MFITLIILIFNLRIFINESTLLLAIQNLVHIVQLQVTHVMVRLVLFKKTIHSVFIILIQFIEVFLLLKILKIRGVFYFEVTFLLHHLKIVIHVFEKLTMLLRTLFELTSSKIRIHDLFIIQNANIFLLLV